MVGLPRAGLHDQGVHALGESSRADGLDVWLAVGCVDGGRPANETRLILRENGLQRDAFNRKLYLGNTT